MFLQLAFLNISNRYIIVSHLFMTYLKRNTFCFFSYYELHIFAVSNSKNK